MGWRRRAAGGLAAVLGAGLAGPAYAGPVRVVEAEQMQSKTGVVVRAAEAAGGRALQLRSSHSALAEVTSPAAGGVVLRARAAGCGRARALSVSVDGGPARTVKPRVRWREQRVKLTLAPGPHRIEIGFRGAKRKRCHALVDRLRLPAPRKQAATAPVVEAPAAAPPPGIFRHVPLGASVQQQHLVKEPAFDAAFRREFASLTPENEMKMHVLQPERGQWDFSGADALVDYAVKHGKAVRGHTLVFGDATSSWVKRLLLPDEVEKALREHVFGVMQRYKHQIREWDVVNEALDERGQYRINPWSQALGPRYVELAFRFAREADPTAKLIYNEYEADVAGIKRDATVELARGLKEKGLIDGVGLQMHRSLADAPSREQLMESLRIYEAMGLEVQITEMDVIAGGETPLADRLNIQADAYRRAAEACALVAACTRFTVWGVTDKYSWRGADQLPLLLDDAYAPKPALAAVRAVLGS